MATPKTLKIGLFGFGHLGKIHLKCLRETPFDIVGVYDPQLINGSLSDYPDLKIFENEESLIQQVDAVDIVTNTTIHYELTKKALNAGKHVFVEKPFTSAVKEARILKDLMNESMLIGQVGHVERYNPAFVAAKNVVKAPKFIEAHRLGMLNPRGTDVSVILDLMIHDLDLILDLVHSKVAKVEANGLSVINATPDIGNARITFENGCVANITASRISMKQMRKIRIFQNDAYLSIDFLKKDCQIIRLTEIDPKEDYTGKIVVDTYRGKKKVDIHSPEIKPNNAITQELADFYLSILNKKQPKVGFEAGYQSIKLAHMIEKKIEMNLKKMNK